MPERLGRLAIGEQWLVEGGKRTRLSDLTTERLLDLLSKSQYFTSLRHDLAQEYDSRLKGAQAAEPGVRWMSTLHDSVAVDVRDPSSTKDWDFGFGVGVDPYSGIRPVDPKAPIEGTWSGAPILWDAIRPGVAMTHVKLAEAHIDALNAFKRAAEDARAALTSMSAFSSNADCFRAVLGYYLDLPSLASLPQEASEMAARLLDYGTIYNYRQPITQLDIDTITRATAKLQNVPVDLVGIAEFAEKTYLLKFRTKDFRHQAAELSITNVVKDILKRRPALAEQSPKWGFTDPADFRDAILRYTQAYTLSRAAEQLLNTPDRPAYLNSLQTRVTTALAFAPEPSPALVEEVLRTLARLNEQAGKSMLIWGGTEYLWKGKTIKELSDVELDDAIAYVRRIGVDNYRGKAQSLLDEPSRRVLLDKVRRELTAFLRSESKWTSKLGIATPDRFAVYYILRDVGMSNTRALADAYRDEGLDGFDLRTLSGLEAVLFGLAGTKDTVKIPWGELVHEYQLNRTAESRGVEKDSADISNRHLLEVIRRATPATLYAQIGRTLDEATAQALADLLTEQGYISENWATSGPFQYLATLNNMENILKTVLERIGPASLIEDIEARLQEARKDTNGDLAKAITEIQKSFYDDQEAEVPNEHMKISTSTDTTAPNNLGTELTEEAILSGDVPEEVIDHLRAAVAMYDSVKKKNRSAGQVLKDVAKDAASAIGKGSVRAAIGMTNEMAVGQVYSLMGENVPNWAQTPAAKTAALTIPPGMLLLFSEFAPFMGLDLDQRGVKFAKVAAMLALEDVGGKGTLQVAETFGPQIKTLFQMYANAGEQAVKAGVLPEMMDAEEKDEVRRMAQPELAAEVKRDI